MQSLRFLHIPKTAGTTFTKILTRHYNRHFQFSGHMDQDLQKLAKHEKTIQNSKSPIDLYSGHAPITTGIQHIDNIEIITFLRDPIARVKSYCQHIFEGKDRLMNGEMSAKGFDLDEFLFKGYFELNNLQTQMLINQKVCAQEMLLSKDEALSLAFYNLTKNIKSFGLLEYFDESLELFKHEFNWQSIEYTVLNKKDNDKKLTFEPRHIERIKLLNEVDIKLYKKAKSEFFKRLKMIDFNKKRSNSGHNFLTKIFNRD